MCVYFSEIRPISNIKNMETSFFHFTGMDHVVQLQNSYWCWAACLSKIINGLSSRSEIGKNQCELAAFYSTNFTQIVDNNIMYRTTINTNMFITEISNPCCSKRRRGRRRILSKKCDVPLHDKDLELLCKYVGIKASHISDISVLKEYSLIRKILIDNDAPIIVKTKLRSGRSHMILITGFGKSGECEYILASDPLKANSEYTLLEHFLSENKILSAWEVKLKVQNYTKNLEEDTILEDNHTVLEKFIEKNRGLIHNDIAFDGKAMFLLEKISEPFTKRVVLTKKNITYSIIDILNNIDEEEQSAACEKKKKRFRIRRIGNVFSVEKGKD